MQSSATNDRDSTVTEPEIYLPGTPSVKTVERLRNALKRRKR